MPLGMYIPRYDQPKVKLVGIAIRGELRYEKDLAQHFMSVALRDIFPPWRETDATYKAWSDRIIDERTQVEIYNRNTRAITAG